MKNPTNAEKNPKLPAAPVLAVVAPHSSSSALLDDLFSLSFSDLKICFSSHHTLYFHHLNFENSNQDLFREYVDRILICGPLIVIQKFVSLQWQSFFVAPFCSFFVHQISRACSSTFYLCL